MIVQLPEAPETTQNLEVSPFYVGQTLSLTGVTSPVQSPVILARTPVKITSITRNADLSLSLGVDGAISPNGTVAWNSLKLAEPNVVGTNTLVVSTCELGLAEMVGGQVKENALEYFTWTSEEYSNGQRTMNKVFEVEPEAVNAFLLFDTNTSNLISNNINVSSYRMRVDNNDVYNRDIVVNKVNRPIWNINYLSFSKFYYFFTSGFGKSMCKC